jgi:hypothetical protein
MPASNNKVTVVELDDEDIPKADHGDRSDLRGAHTVSTPSRSRTGRPNGKRSIIIASAIALAIGGMYAARHLRKSGVPEALFHDKAASEKPPGSSLAGPLEPSLPVLSASQHKTAVTGSGPASPIGAPPAPSATIKSGAVTAVDLTEIHESIAQLRTDLTTLAGRAEQMASEVASIKTDLAEHQAKGAAATEVSRVVPRRSLAKAKPTVADKPAAVIIGVLSVDTWDGRPSISVSQGQEIRFISEGDALPGGYVLKQADGRKQQATFTAPSGQTLGTRSTVEESH